MKWRRAATGLCTALALAACGAEREEPSQPDAQAAQAKSEAAPAAETQPAPAPPTPDRSGRWLLAEFDWGDSEEIVYETVRFTDGFLCYKHKLFEHCAFVKTKVDGEELLAKFLFVDGKLWRIDVLTPDLDAEQSDAHLERVWKLLAAYVTRFHGEAPERAPFPQRDALAPKQEIVTHRWELPEQEIRIVVGRAATEPKWFTAARFIDPKWAKQEPPPEAEKRAPVPKS